jgi:phage tail P2-like protein
LPDRTAALARLGLSLDNWSTDWPESIKRERVRKAIAIARRKGTAQSVRTVVASFGGSVAIREWWQSEPRACRTRSA